jgi:hypothetical protein
MPRRSGAFLFCRTWSASCRTARAQDRPIPAATLDTRTPAPGVARASRIRFSSAGGRLSVCPHPWPARGQHGLVPQSSPARTRQTRPIICNPACASLPNSLELTPARCSGSAALSSRTRSRREAGQTVAGPRFRRIQVCPKDLRAALRQAGGVGG